MNVIVKVNYAIRYSKNEVSLFQKMYLISVSEQKRSFPLRISSVNVTNSPVNCGSIQGVFRGYRNVTLD